MPMRMNLMLTHCFAGQGYIWLAHRQPDTPGWAIAQRSKHLWESMLDSNNLDASIRLSSKEGIEWQAWQSFVLHMHTFT